MKKFFSKILVLCLAVNIISATIATTAKLSFMKSVVTVEAAVLPDTEDLDDEDYDAE